MGILRDWIALPFILIGSLFYSIGEVICGKKFSRRGDMAIAESTYNAGRHMNRKERRRRR